MLEQNEQPVRPKQVTRTLIDIPDFFVASIETDYVTSELGLRLRSIRGAGVAYAIWILVVVGVFYVSQYLLVRPELMTGQVPRILLLVIKLNLIALPTIYLFTIWTWFKLLNIVAPSKARSLVLFGTLLLTFALGNYALFSMINGESKHLFRTMHNNSLLIAGFCFCLFLSQLASLVEEDQLAVRFRRLGFASMIPIIFVELAPILLSPFANELKAQQLELSTILFYSMLFLAPVLMYVWWLFMSGLGQLIRRVQARSSGSRLNSSTDQLER